MELSDLLFSKSLPYPSFFWLKVDSVSLHRGLSISWEQEKVLGLLILTRFTLYPMIQLKVLFIFRSFLDDSLGFPMYTNMSSANSTYSFSISMTFFLVFIHWPKHKMVRTKILTLMLTLGGKHLVFHH